MNYDISQVSGAGLGNLFPPPGKNPKIKLTYIN